MFSYYEWLLLAFPIIGACTNVLAGERLSRRGQNAAAMVGASGPLLIVLPLLVGMVIDPELVGRPAAFRWMQVWSGSRYVEARFALRLDTLSILLTATMVFGGWFVHLHATRNLALSAARPFALAQLNGALAAAMIVLLADDMLFLLLGWSLSGWLTYGLLRAERSHLTSTSEGERVPILAFWVTSDVLLLIATGIVSRRFASLSLNDLIALSPAPGLQQVPPLSLVAVVALVCVAAMLRMGVFPWNLPLPTASAHWSRAMAWGLVLFLPGVYLLARLYPLLSSTSVLPDTIAWWGALAALLMGLSAAAQPPGQDGTRLVLLGRASLLLLAIGTGSLLAALALLPVFALSQTLLFLLPVFARPTVETEPKPVGTAWIKALGMAALLGLPPFGGFPFSAYVVATLFRTNLAFCGFLLGALFLLAAGAARTIWPLQAERDHRPSFATLWVLSAVIVVLGLSSSASPTLLPRLLAPTVGDMPDHPAWWWFALVTATTGSGALVGYTQHARIEHLQHWFTTWVPSGERVERIWERAAIQPALAASSFLARVIEPRWADSTFGLLGRWIAVPDRESGALCRLPALIALLMLAAAAILIYLLLVR